VKTLDKPVEVGIRKLCTTQEEVDFWTERFNFSGGEDTDLPEYDRMKDAMVQATVRYREIIMDPQGYLDSLKIPGGVDEEERQLAVAIHYAKKFVGSYDIARYILDGIESGRLLSSLPPF
jgi:hypothetical protein